MLRNFSKVVQLETFLFASVADRADDGSYEALSLSGVAKVRANGLLV